MDSEDIVFIGMLAIGFLFIVMLFTFQAGIHNKLLEAAEICRDSGGKPSIISSNVNCN